MACFVGCFVSQPAKQNQVEKNTQTREHHNIGPPSPPSHHSEAKPFCSHFSLEFSEPKISSGHTNGWKTIENQFISMAVEDWTCLNGKVAAASCHVSAQKFFFFAFFLTPPKGRARKVLSSTGNYAVFSHFASFFTPSVIVRFPGKVQQGIRDSSRKKSWKEKQINYDQASPSFLYSFFFFLPCRRRR